MISLANIPNAFIYRSGNPESPEVTYSNSIRDIFKRHLQTCESAQLTLSVLQTRPAVEVTKFYNRSIDTCSECGTHNKHINGKFKSWVCDGCNHEHNTVENMRANTNSLHFSCYMQDLFHANRLGDEIPDIVPYKGIKTKYHKAKKPGVITFLELGNEICRRYGLDVLKSWQLVRELCAENSGWLPKHELEKKISERTGKSINTAKRWLSKLKGLKFIYQKDKKIHLIAQKKIAVLYNKTNRRSFRVKSVDNNYKSIFIQATHRYLEDGYYQNYYGILNWAHGVGTLTDIQVLSIPDKRNKVGCAAQVLADYLNLSYSTVYNYLKGTVILQYNYFHYTHKQFSDEFSIGFFRANPRFSYIKSKSGVLLVNRISSKSTYTGLFNASKDRFYCSIEQIENLCNQLNVSKLHN